MRKCEYERGKNEGPTHFTSVGVSLRKFGGKGHSSGGSHLFEFVKLDRLPDEVAEIDGHFTFGEAPVTRFIAADTVVELIGMRSSNTTDFFCVTLCCGEFEALCSNSFRSFSF